MQRKRLEYLTSSQRDLRRIAEYHIETAGIATTARIGREIGKTILQIAEHPEIGHKLETAPYRQLVVGQYFWRNIPASRSCSISRSTCSACAAG